MPFADIWTDFSPMLADPDKRLRGCSPLFPYMPFGPRKTLELSLAGTKMIRERASFA